MKIELINRIDNSYCYRIDYQNNEYILNDTMDKTRNNYKISLTSTNKDLPSSKYQEVIKQYILES